MWPSESGRTPLVAGIGGCGRLIRAEARTGEARLGMRPACVGLCDRAEGCARRVIYVNHECYCSCLPRASLGIEAGRVEVVPWGSLPGTWVVLASLRLSAATNCACGRHAGGHRAAQTPSEACSEVRMRRDGTL